MLQLLDLYVKHVKNLSCDELLTMNAKLTLMKIAIKTEEISNKMYLRTLCCGVRASLIALFRSGASFSMKYWSEQHERIKMLGWAINNCNESL